jgi:GTP pyrophosphokinase/guanosine-3',5'-bis(diphosphate) 3'-pyrophosphohydrolase
MGQELARAAFEHVGKKATDKVLETAAKKLRISNMEELLARLGNAELRARDVVHSVYTELAAEKQPDVDSRRAVIGLQPGQSFTRSQCCQALPGERIIGIVSQGQGVSVHAIDCHSLIRYEDTPELWLDLHWHSGTHGAVYSTTLDVTISNDAGVLGRICTLIGELQSNISDLEFIERNPDFYRMNISVELRDIEHLHALTTVLEAEVQVTSLKRLRHRQLAIDDKITI